MFDFCIKILGVLKCITGFELPKYTYTLIQLPPPPKKYNYFIKCNCLLINNSQYLLIWLCFSSENIVLYGQSIGTVPTIDLASRYEVRAVILHSPLASGLRVACPDTKKTWCFDVFPSIEKICKFLT